MEKTYTEGQTRAWLQARIENFTPRIKREKPTKTKRFKHPLEDLYRDLVGTLTELNERIQRTKVENNPQPHP